MDFIKLETLFEIYDKGFYVDMEQTKKQGVICLEREEVNK